MNHYPHFLGDYARDTRHLSVTEHGAYRLLLDTSYATEKPLPVALPELCRICGASNAMERKAVAKVAEEFFPVNGDGRRHNKRVDEEIAKAHAFAQAQAERAQKGWQRRKNAGAMPVACREDTGNMPEGCRIDANHNHNHNHKPLKEKSTSTTLAPDAARRGLKVAGPKIEFAPDKGAFIGITEEQELTWQEAYPAVPIPPAIARAAAWAKQNPANRKSNWGRFLVNWFSREQDRAGRVKR